MVGFPLVFLVNQPINGYPHILRCQGSALDFGLMLHLESMSSHRFVSLWLPIKPIPKMGTLKKKCVFAKTTTDRCPNGQKPAPLSKWQIRGGFSCFIHPNWCKQNVAHQYANLHGCVKIRYPQNGGPLMPWWIISPIPISHISHSFSKTYPTHSPVLCNAF